MFFFLARRDPEVAIRKYSSKQVPLKIFQNSQENTYVEVYF